MKLSAPIYSLKRHAKTLSREAGIPLHAALDQVALQEGYASWSLLAAKLSSPSSLLYAQLSPGDLVLIGARPGQGKTLLSLELAVEAMKAGHRSVFFSLEYTATECAERFQSLGVDLASYAGLFEFDGSDLIQAHYVIDRLAGCARGTLVVIDYLQLLDQKRHTPPLLDQVQSLRLFAREKGVTIVFLSQISRDYNPTIKPCPDLSDVRLPNPLDLSLFDKTCFLHGGEMKVGC